jgi:long-chain acyl-CoA synthetase
LQVLSKKNMQQPLVPAHQPANSANESSMRISEVFKQWSERSPEQPALVENGSVWTYGQLASIVSATKRWLLEKGVRPGDRILLVGDNSRPFVALLLAIADLDAWAAPLSANISTSELEAVHHHCEARRIIYTVCGPTEALACAKRRHGSVAEIAEIGPVVLGSIDEHSRPEAIDANPSERVGALLYTSGTTGVPKGVMLSHKALLFLATGSAKIRSLTPDDRVYGVLPMSHVTGLSVVLLGGLSSGATIYLARRFDPVATLRSLETEKITFVLGVPGMYSILLEYAKMKGIRSLTFPALRVIASSGAPLDLAVKSKVESLFGLVLHNGYGSTETSPTIAQTRIEFPRSDISVGPLFPGVEAKFVGPDGEPVPEGETGELLVRGPNVMKGYYRAPEETRTVIDAEGWFNTRDLARMENGNLFIVGRTKDLIICFGHNVYPAEVESVLNSHPAVARAAVIGRATSDATGGEEIIAIVQRSPGSSVSASDLVSYCSQHLVTYKRPRQIIFIDQMPLTATGKIKKHDLKVQVDSLQKDNPQAIAV